MKLLSPFNKRSLSLKNHFVMAPMTRCRATDNIPNELMAKYYGQRTEAGLIITEGTSPSPAGVGYARIPGIYNEAQIEGWKLVTDRVHQDGSKIFIQLMHTGRVGHTDNLPPAITLIGVSDIASAGQIFTEEGMKDYTQPTPLTTNGVKEVVAEFAEAALNSVKAGFDGIELHGANGYLLEQFLNPHINNREDEYGGSAMNRCRFIIEVAKATADAIGKEKVGIRLSPFSVLGDLPAYEAADVEETYEYLFKELNKLGIVYIHISSNPDITENLIKSLHAYYSGIIIWCNGLTPASGENVVANEKADLAAFGRLFLANPDLLSRIKAGASLNDPDATTFFSPGPAGYTDYPMLA